MTVRWVFAVTALALTSLAAPSASSPQTKFKFEAQLKKAVADPRRTPENKLRDRYRHPFETLSFFGVKPSDTVVEIWPSRGWYTEILAPYLSAAGHAERRARARGRPTKGSPGDLSQHLEQRVPRLRPGRKPRP